MIKKSFRAKLLLIYILSIVIGMTALIATSNFIYRPILINDTRESMVAYSELTTRNYLRGASNLKRDMDQFDSSHDIQSIIFNKDFVIEYNSAEDIYPESYRMNLLREWMAIYDEKKSADGTYFGEIEENSDNLDRAVYIRQIDDDTYLCMSKVVKSIDQAVNIANSIVAIGAVILVIMVTLVWNGLTRPYMLQLKKMSLVTKNMARMNFDEKIDYNSEDEIGVLAKNIDEMSEELKGSVESLRQDIERRKRLIRDISHELKTPVTTVSGYTETIQILVPDNPRVQKYCEIMMEECDVINTLVQEMLYMSKLESETFECNKVLFPVAELQEKLQSRTVNEFTMDDIVFDMYPAEITADINLMKRALFNYITNAIKYRTPGSVIEVKGYADGEYYTFSVTNEGKEISEKERALIWDVFYKCDEARSRSGGGHGIGLAIVKRIASLHGGEVDLISENGKNTFYIKIKQ